VAAYCLFAFTACLRPRSYLRRPGRTETGVRCSPGLRDGSPPFWFRHLTYATSCRTNNLIPSGQLLDYIPVFRLEIGEKSGALLLILADNKPGFGEKNLITSAAAGIH
jgi:hypothetical protein